MYFITTKMRYAYNKSTMQIRFNVGKYFPTETNQLFRVTVMGIALTLQEFLDWENIDYSIIHHSYTDTSMNTAMAAHIPPRQLAKSVVLCDEEGFIMVLVPADQHVDLPRVNSLYNRHFHLANELEITDLFYDCEEGAVPALGEAYGFEVMVDEQLEHNRQIYLEGGDHRALIRLPAETFHNLMADAEHGHYCS